MGGMHAGAPRRTYLDANATEPLRPQAREAVLSALDLVGNPSSIHAAGREARRALEAARAEIAECLGALPSEIVFTSGATEACGLAMTGLGPYRQVVIGATEHDCVRKAAPDALVLPVDADGGPDLARLQAFVAAGPTLVCLMLANNETGVIHPVAEAAAICHAHGALLHVDAAQAFGRIAFTMASLGADSVAVSGHKIGGPKGVGALVLRAGLDVRPSIVGGGQERGRRGGTQNLPAIAGFGAAALAAASGSQSVTRLRDRLEAEAVVRGAIVCGGGPRLPNTTCLALPGQRADMQVIALDLAGIAVSAGAACSSGKVAASHVLQAMGLGELSACAIRVSLPWNATEADVEAFAAAYANLAKRVGRA